MLAQALTVHEQSRCPGGCGHYADEAHSDDNDGAFEVDTSRYCHACAALEIYRRSQREKKVEPEPGQLTVVRKLTRRLRRKG